MDLQMIYEWVAMHLIQCTMDSLKICTGVAMDLLLIYSGFAMNLLSNY